MATIIGVLVNATNPFNEVLLRDLQAAARTLGVQLHVLQASSERDFDTVFATLAQLRAGALVISVDPFFASRSEQLAALALSHAIPTIFLDREFVAAGGLLSYGGNSSDMYRIAGVYTGPDSQGREARRSAGPASHENRADHKPQDRQGARS
jgi:putative ABC transport system substrate-binding protein